MRKVRKENGFNTATRMHLALTKSQRSRLVRDNQKIAARYRITQQPEETFDQGWIEAVIMSDVTVANPLPPLLPLDGMRWHGGNVNVDRRARRGRIRGDVLIWSGRAMGSGRLQSLPVAHGPSPSESFLPQLPMLTRLFLLLPEKIRTSS